MIMKKLLFIVLSDTVILLAPAINTSAQWKQLNVGAPGQINAIATFSAGVYAGTDAGIYRSTDNGGHWTMVSSQFADCFAARGAEIFAGTLTGVVRSTDNVKSWTAFSSGLPGSPNAIAVHGSEIFAGLLQGLYASKSDKDDWVNNGLGLPVGVDAIFVTDSAVFAGCAMSGLRELQLLEITGLEQKKPVNTPTCFELEQNYPNPFNPTTRIRYAISSKEYVVLKVYDVLGRDVATLVSEVKNPGSYEVRFDGSRFASGVYFYQLITNGYVLTKKMAFVK